MVSFTNQDSHEKISFHQFFSLVFVLFFLYLLGDAFYRWDGFRYYASFYDFIPSVALVSILWSLTAFSLSVLLFPVFRLLEWFFASIKWKLRFEHMLFFIGVVLFEGILLWKGKLPIWGYVQTSVKLKQYLLLFTIIVSTGLTWLCRHQVAVWTRLVLDRITPLIWMFGIWVMLSVPLVAYHTLVEKSVNTVLESTPLPSSVKNDRPNIILLTFDALSARNMSAYNYSRATTPFIAEWAKNAHVFSLVEAENNYTVSTTASLMTGKRVWTHRHYHPYDQNPVRGKQESLPLLLKENGYFNMAYVVNSYAEVKKLKISDAFDIAPPVSDFRKPVFIFRGIDKMLYQLFDNRIKMHEWFIKEDFILYKFINRFIFGSFVPDKIKSHFKSEASEKKYVLQSALAKFLDVIDNNPPMPFFVWIHLNPPHFPYMPSQPYLGIYNSSPEARSATDQKVQRLIVKKNQQKIGYTFPEAHKPVVNLLRDRYDEFIRYCDRQFENFISELETRNVLENTVVILSSDHGESFEHGYFEHDGIHLYEQVTHIPLIIREPEQSEGVIIKSMVEQIDIPATILDLADIQVPPWMEGRSLLPLMRGEKLTPRPIFSMALQTNKSRGNEMISSGTIAVWEGYYKLIYYMDKEKNMLFNLGQDPGEIQNLFDQEPEISQHLLSLIRDNLKKANEKIRKVK